MGNQMRDFLILIADDNPVIVEMLTRRLERRGFKTISCATGLEAAQKACQHRPDAIILDLSMPGMTGFQVCRLIKTDEEMGDTPIIILTARDRQYDEFWARMSGADYYMRKGRDDEKLFETLEKLLRERAPRDRRPVNAKESARPAELIRKLNNLLEKELRHVTVLAEMAKVACHFEDVDATLASILTILSGLTDSLWTFLGVIREEGNLLYLLRSNQETKLPTDALLWRLRCELEEKTTGSWRRAILYGGGASEERLLPETPPATQVEGVDVVCIPFRSQRATRGVLGVLFNRDDPPTKSESELLENSAPQVAITVASALLYDKMTRMARTDALTGLANRRTVMERIQEEMDRARRYGAPLSIAIVDIDHFKRINDRYGHVVGDAVLRRVAQRIDRSIRKTDKVGRIGGEEFLILMPHTDCSQAVTTADRVREEIERLGFSDIASDISVTASIGVAQMSEDPSPEKLISRADAAMYAAKRAGRNRVMMSPLK